HRRGAQRARDGWVRVLGKLLAQQAVGYFLCRLAAAVPAADPKDGEAGEAAAKADERRAEHDQRERYAEEEYADEGRGSEGDHDLVLERAPADADYGLQNDGEHRGLEAEEQRLDD